MSEQWKKGLLAAGWTVHAAVELAVDVERIAQRLYRELARRWEHEPALQRLFTHVAGEEAAHEADLRRLLAGATRTEAELDGEALKALARAAFFSAESGFLVGIEHASSPLQVLEIVLRLERGSALYYRGLRDVLGASAILDAMIAEEEQHVASVRRAIEAYSAREPAPRKGRDGGRGNAVS